MLKVEGKPITICDERGQPKEFSATAVKLFVAGEEDPPEDEDNNEDGGEDNLD